MGLLYDKINNKITSLKQEYLTNKNVNHQGIKGSFNESELSELIEKVIPERYIVTNNTIAKNITQYPHES